MESPCHKNVFKNILGLFDHSNENIPLSRVR
jgi:hypothetical protein